jgi:glycosyltransferase involved in cell wall biosynthesis
MFEVDVIIPVHNASDTIQAAVESAMSQEYPSHGEDEEASNEFQLEISVTVCCYDDGSTDESLKILKRLQREYDAKATLLPGRIPSRLLVGSSSTGVGRGAGYARNRAIEMNNPLHLSNTDRSSIKFLCLLDSDDTMHKHRVALQTLCMMNLDDGIRQKTLLGCTFARDPPDSTWHYSRWANSLSDERLSLERFREVTILQPTWFMPYSVFATVGGYVEAPAADETFKTLLDETTNSIPRLIHPRFDTSSSLRLAEDLRFFHAHLHSHGQLRLLRSRRPLVQYRYCGDAHSQSFRTSRKLLLQLRVLAFEQCILDKDPLWQDHEGMFVIWGAGRDGKDFFKALEPRHQERVFCFVDVDAKKLAAGYYIHRTDVHQQTEAALKIPIVHFSFLVPDPHIQKDLQQKWHHDEMSDEKLHGCIDKSKVNRENAGKQPAKRQKTNPRQIHLCDQGLNHQLLQKLPVVVCVSMGRTNGVLEKNVLAIQRIEGENLWHFS